MLKDMMNMMNYKRQNLVDIAIQPYTAPCRSHIPIQSVCALPRKTSAGQGTHRFAAQATWQQMKAWYACQVPIFRVILDPIKAPGLIATRPHHLYNSRVLRTKYCLSKSFPSFLLRLAGSSLKMNLAGHFRRSVPGVIFGGLLPNLTALPSTLNHRVHLVIH